MSALGQKPTDALQYARRKKKDRRKAVLRISDLYSRLCRCLPSFRHISPHSPMKRVNETQSDNSAGRKTFTRKFLSPFVYRLAIFGQAGEGRVVLIQKPLDRRIALGCLTSANFPAHDGEWTRCLFNFFFPGLAGDYRAFMPNKKATSRFIGRRLLMVELARLFRPSLHPRLSFACGLRFTTLSDAIPGCTFVQPQSKAEYWKQTRDWSELNVR